jgi:hypothetical protein
MLQFFPRREDGRIMCLRNVSIHLVHTALQIRGVTPTILLMFMHHLTCAFVASLVQYGTTIETPLSQALGYIHARPTWTTVPNPQLPFPASLHI